MSPVLSVRFGIGTLLLHGELLFMYVVGRACGPDVLSCGLSTEHCIACFLLCCTIATLAAFWCAGTVSSYAHVMADPCAAPPPAQPPPPALGPKVEFTTVLPGLSVADFGEMQQAAFRAFVQQAAAGVAHPSFPT